MERLPTTPHDAVFQADADAKEVARDFSGYPLARRLFLQSAIWIHEAGVREFLLRRQFTQPLFRYYSTLCIPNTAPGMFAH